MDNTPNAPTTLEQLENSVDHLLERLSRLQQEKEALQSTLQHVQRQKNLSIEKQQHAQDKLRKIIGALREQLSRDEMIADATSSHPTSCQHTIASEADLDDDFISDEPEGAPI
ncbi:MAG: hypothetical protein A3J38_06250 [Gammaproteobacteria bacterium RIFCSPHIGHO2_12_FULL_45_9]|nr:MAG: hypothetical protein A3J38_06250 [Gammaproteobacteria bacterium RIFCSPHIGHO2_12_FULL_45_9]